MRVHAFALLFVLCALISTTRASDDEMVRFFFSLYSYSSLLFSSLLVSLFCIHPLSSYSNFTL